jgi:co-chaperonin GroES (HSP10)
MKLVPIGEWVLAEELKPEEKTKGGIIIAAPSKKKRVIKRCKIIQMDPNISEIRRADEEPHYFVEGDIVIVHKDTGLEVDPNDPDNRKLYFKYGNVIAVEREE